MDHILSELYCTNFYYFHGNFKPIKDPLSETLHFSVFIESAWGILLFLLSTK